MITVRLMGGLGNQLFQYAAGRALSIYKDTYVCLDVSWFAGQILRKFELSNFNIRCPTVLLKSTDELLKETGADGNWWSKFCVKEPHFHYSDDFWSIGSNAVLDGYWQSEKYFRMYRSIIVSDLSFPVCDRDDIREYIRNAKDSESVCLHFRRGDYVSNPTTAQMHGALDIAYYKSSIDCIMKRVRDPKFFVFSDDMEWVEQNLRIQLPTIFVRENKGNPIDDLRIMAACKHHIVANSSFSWWGAWLAGHDDQIVCAPQRWFLGLKHDTRDLVPARWTVL